MRRLLSLAMLLLLALPLVAPALGQTTQQRVLLCCRKGGAHHCVGSAPVGSTMVRERCPAGSAGMSAVRGLGYGAGGEGRVGEGLVVAGLEVGNVEAGYRVSLGRAGSTRGPPVVVRS